MIKVYIASPYTLGNKEENVRKQIYYAHILMEKGYSPYAPLLSHYQDLIYPRSYDSWLAHDILWLRLCDVVLRLSGESRGADLEVKLAKELGIPVVYDDSKIEEAYNNLHKTRVIE